MTSISRLRAIVRENTRTGAPNAVARGNLRRAEGAAKTPTPAPSTVPANRRRAF